MIYRYTSDPSLFIAVKRQVSITICADCSPIPSLNWSRYSGPPQITPALSAFPSLPPQPPSLTLLPPPLTNPALRTRGAVWFIVSHLPPDVYSSLIVEAVLYHSYLFDQVTDFPRKFCSQRLVPATLDICQQLFLIGVPEGRPTSQALIYHHPQQVPVQDFSMSSAP